MELYLSIKKYKKIWIIHESNAIAYRGQICNENFLFEGNENTYWS